MMKVLLPTDFSKSARKAIDYAINVFGTEDVEYHLLNVYSEPHSGADMLVSIVDLLERESKKELEMDFNRLLEKKPDLALNLKCKSIHGGLIPTIKKMKFVEKYDFIVMGTNGTTGLKKVFVGSNTFDVIKHRIAPTILVPFKMKKENISKILVGFDVLSFNDSDLFDSLVKLIEECQPSIEFAHVTNAEFDLVNQSHEIGGILDSYDKKVEYKLINIKDKDVISGLLNYVHQEDIDLLVMIVRRHSLFNHLFHKNKTINMAMKTDVPMLVVHEK